MDASVWLRSFAEALGTELPGEADVAVLLELASVAAHASERRSAPIACWLAARAGAAPADALAVARTVTDPPPAG
ncbi:MAG: DUF6457 domain-containing protein [Actinomycetota bacterium]